MVGRRRLWQSRRRRIKQLEVNDPWARTPEQELVRLTYEHPRFKTLYNFPSYEEGWVQTKRGRATDASNPERLISLDCEMVLCEGEVYEVVQICVVDRHFETLLNLLVKPSKIVVDYLTHITGLSQEDLENVSCSQVDAQKQVRKLVKPGTILVGHSLYHDLKALKIHHDRVIDTSLLFKHHKRPDSYSPSLSNLCKAVLGFDFRQEGKPHNCLDDAIIPMQLVLHELEHGPSDPLRIAIPRACNEKNSQLFIHKVPPFISSFDLRKLFPKEYKCEIEPINRRNSKVGTTFAVFKSKEEADTAFDLVDGTIGKDSWGRLQKLVIFSVATKLGKAQNIEVCVRKMQEHNERSNEELEDGEIQVTNMENSTVGSVTHVNVFNAQALTKRRSHNGEAECVRKTRRTVLVNDDNNIVDHGHDATIPVCEHVQEIEILKKQLKARDVEVLALRKLVASLQRIEEAS